MPVTDPRDWSVDDVAAFLAENELDQYIPQIRTEKIDGSTLLECSKEDLVELGLKGVHAARLVASFKKAADAFPSTVLPPAPAPASVPPPRPSDAALCALLEKVGGTFEQAVHARELDWGARELGWGPKKLNADDAKVVAYVVAVSSSLVTLKYATTSNRSQSVRFCVSAP